MVSACVYTLVGCGGGGGIKQRNNGFCQHFSLGESCLSILTLMPDNLFLLICLWRFSSCCPRARAQSKWYHQQMNPCAGSLRGAPGTPADLLIQPQSPLVFIARSSGNFSSQHRIPGLGSLVWGWESFALHGRHPQLRYLSWFLTTICGYGNIPFWFSTPPISLEVASSICP